MNANPVIFISNPLIHLAFLNTLLRLANFLSTTQRILKYVYLVYFLFLGIINLNFFSLRGLLESISTALLWRKRAAAPGMRPRLWMGVGNTGEAQERWVAIWLVVHHNSNNFWKTELPLEGCALFFLLRAIPSIYLVGLMTSLVRWSLSKKKYGADRRNINVQSTPVNFSKDSTHKRLWLWGSRSWSSSSHPPTAPNSNEQLPTWRFHHLKYQRELIEFFHWYAHHLVLKH